MPHRAGNRRGYPSQPLYASALRAFHSETVSCSPMLTSSLKSPRRFTVSPCSSALLTATSGSPTRESSAPPVWSVPNSWRIESTFFPEATEVAYYDGTNTVTFKRYDTNLVAGLPATVLAKSGENQHPHELELSFADLGMLPPEIVSVQISDEPHPMGGPGLNLPWLAFCSGSYLRSKPDTLTVPMVTNTRNTPDSFAYSFTVRTFADGLGLPRDVEFYVSHSRLERAIRDPRLIRSQRMLLHRRNPGLPLASPDGALKCRYEVLNTTNWHGWTFPQHFLFSQFAGEKMNRLRYRVDGRILSIHSADDLSPRFGKGRDVTVTDFRFRSKGKLVDYLEYRTNFDGTVPSRSDPRLLALFNTRVATAPTDPGDWLARAKVRGILGALVLLLVLPVALCFYRWRRGRTPTETSPGFRRVTNACDSGENDNKE